MEINGRVGGHAIRSRHSSSAAALELSTKWKNIEESVGADNEEEFIHARETVGR